MEYKNTFKKIWMILLITILIIITSKLFVFYIPFFIAYMISIMIEPIIKLINKNTSLTRKTSSVLTLITVFAILASLISFGIITLVSESTNLLSALNTYLEIAINFVNTVIENVDRFNMSDEEKAIFEEMILEVLNNGTEILKNFINGFLEYIKSIPKILIYVVITILSTYFISSDKIYIKDRLEHHIPKKILGKIYTKIDKIIQDLGGYLKAEIKMILISFFIVLMGLNIFYLIGMDVGYPLIMALIIAFVDAMPILGAGVVMVPWSIILFLNKNYYVGFSILGLYIFVLAVRQFAEPKIVSSNIGIHPIFTLISMYTGFKIIGILGLLLGPIALIILKNVFENTLDRGIIKSILDK